MLKLLVFDLDGTLADTRLDLAESVNAALARVGRSPLPIATVVSFVGDGARNLITRSLMASGDGRPDAAEIDATLEAFLAHYQDHCLGATRAYAGVDAALDRLSGYRKAVLTNKPGAPARKVLEGLGLARHFVHVFGGDNPYGQKPDPAALRKLMEMENARPGETAMIAGDFATKAADVRIGFLDRFSGALVLHGSVGAVEEALAQTCAALGRLLDYSVCPVTRS